MPQQLIIVLGDDGRINVNGPIHNKVLAFGMLEAAKDAVRDFITANKSDIVVAGRLPGNGTPQG